MLCILQTTDIQPIHINCVEPKIKTKASKNWKKKTEPKKKIDDFVCSNLKSYYNNFANPILPQYRIIRFLHYGEGTVCIDAWNGVFVYQIEKKKTQNESVFFKPPETKNVNWKYTIGIATTS